MAIGVKAPKGVSKAPSPRNNPMGRVRPPLGFPHVTPPRVRRTSRNYSKIPPVPNPAGDAPYGDASFGDTGLTGES